MNKVILMGRLARDPELRYTQAGKAVSTFTLAVDRQQKKVEGQQTADFVPVVAWEKLAELSVNYLAKGRQVLLEGRMQVRDYVAQDGSRRWTTEVIAERLEFTGKKSDNADTSGEDSQAATSNDFGGTREAVADDIPF